MSDLQLKFKAQDTLSHPNPKKARRQAAHMSRDFDPLTALDDDYDVVNDEDTSLAKARRKVNEWLDHTDLGVKQSVSSDIQGLPTEPTTLDDPLPDVGDDDAADRPVVNTLEFVSDVLDRPIDDSESLVATSAPPLVPLTESAARIMDDARQRDMADVDDDAELVTTSTEPNRPPGPVGISYPADPTREIVRHPKPYMFSSFHTMLAMWENEHNITREAHAQLVEIFQLAQTLEEIQQISKRHATSVRRVVDSLPLLKIRTLPVQLDYTTLPSRAKLQEDLEIFDMSSIVTSILSSPCMRRRIYRGMAHLVAGRIKSPWQANWWGESIRSTSGQFFHYTDGTPIFPSDFIQWTCPRGNCIAKHSLNCGIHLGRVRYCGWDKRLPVISSPVAGNAASNVPILLVQMVVDRDRLDDPMLRDISMTCFSQRTRARTELIIIEDVEVELSPSNVVAQLPSVSLDYSYDPKGPIRPGPLTASYTVRLVYNDLRRQYRVLKLSSPHRAELELNAYGRQHFIDNFAKRSVVSLPFQMFIDAFGLYRNMYRTLMGVYLTPEFYPPELRSKRSNIYPLTLGPHGSDLADILGGLYHMRPLDSGVRLTLHNDKHVFVCSFINCITGDMPSQQKLSGCLGPTATLPCRNCFVKGDDKANLRFDIVNKGRYHMQTDIDRRRVEEIAKSKRHEDSLLRELGLHNNKPLIRTLQTLFPALDMIRSRPVDAAHSEYQGLSRLLHNFMFKDNMSILNAAAVSEACTVYQSFPTPPGWGRLQSPKRHLDSWRMQELARGSIILPMLLRCWLQLDHIRDDCKRVIPRIARDYFDDADFIVPVHNFNAVDWVVSASWLFARSIMAIFGRRVELDSLAHGRDIVDIIISGRRAVQFLCQINASVNRERAVTRSTNLVREAQRNRYAPSQTSRQSFTDNGSDADGTVQSIGAAPALRQRVQPQDKAQSYVNMKGLPNIHSGLHLADVIREYGSCRLVWTLLGEDKHRQFKSDITATNHHNPAATLIAHENISQTLRFLMEGSFETKAPELHEIFQDAKARCPSFARAIVPLMGIYEDDVNVDGTDESKLRGDDRHRRPVTYGRISYTGVTQKRSDMLNVVRLSSNNNKSSAFMRELLVSYNRDYNVPSVVFDGHLLSWWRKLVYMDERYKRVAINVNSFVKLAHDGPTGHVMARLDGIFVHDRANSSWVFLVVTFAEKRATSDYLIQCPLYKMTESTGIVGLSRLKSEHVWMIPGPDNSLLFIDYDISFM